MRISRDWLRRPIASWLVMFLVAPFGEAAVVGSRQTAPQGPGGGASSLQAQPKPSGGPTGNASAETPGADGASGSQNSVRPQSTAPPQASNTPQKTPEGEQTSTPQAVGTAAAPYEKTVGAPSSRPAGAVIAPAKQKRARSFLIKVGVIVGAAIAVGAVVGMSKTSPSRPN